MGACSLSLALVACEIAEHQMGLAQALSVAYCTAEL